MALPRFKLNRTMSADRNVEVDDILKTKQALNALGYYPAKHDPKGAFVDDALFRGIRQFQKDTGLKVDGVINPQGETAAAINHGLRSADPANDIEPPANDDRPVLPQDETESEPDDREDQEAFTDCDSLLRRDELKCFRIKDRYTSGVCMRTAMERYASCLANRILRPPLHLG